MVKLLNYDHCQKLSKNVCQFCLLFWSGFETSWCFKVDS